MSTIHRFASRVFGFGAGLSLALLFAIIFFNSLRRYTVGRSLEWGEELPIYLTIYGVMFGIALAYLDDRHIRLTVLTDALPEKLRQRLFILVDLVTAVVGGLLAWSGYLFALRRGAVDASGLIGSARALAEATGADWLVHLGQMGSWQAALGFGGAALALAAVIRFATRLQER